MNSTYISSTIVMAAGTPLVSFLDHWGQKQISHLQGSKSVDLEGILDQQKVCVFGEPGFGKSRLLRELYLKSVDSKAASIYLDLKQLGGSSLRDFIDKKQGASSDQPDKKWSYRLDGLSKKGDANVCYFLDALDEVEVALIPKVLKDIDRLLETIGKGTVVLSCRTHHAKRFISEFSQIDFTYCMMHPFSGYQVAQFMMGCIPSLKEKTVREIMDELNKYYHRNGFFDWSSTLSTPRYLEYFCALIPKYSFDYVVGLSRVEVFDHFINGRFEDEVEKYAARQPGFKQKIPYIKQCFERIALLMEIQRVNLIHKEDFASFDIDSGLNISGQLWLEIFYDGTLLKDNGQQLEFDNTEFQEYLAAKAIKRLGKADQVIFDVGVDDKLRRFYTPWLNTLSFLVELEPNLLIPLVAFGIQNGDRSLFSLMKYAIVDNYEADVRHQLFSQVVEYYKRGLRTLDQPIARGLTLFFDPKVHEKHLFGLLNQDSDFDIFILGSMAAEILENYLNFGGTTADLSCNWNARLLALIDPKAAHGTRLNYCIFSLLPKVCSVKMFEATGLHLNLLAVNIFKDVVGFYKKKAPNSRTGIDLFLRQVETSNSVSYNSPFELITTKSGFKYLFSRLFNQDVFEKLYHNTYGRLDILSDKVLQNLSEVYDDDLKRLLLYGINTLPTFRRLYRSNLLDRIVCFLGTKEDDLIGLLVDNISSSVGAHGDIHDSYGYLFARMIKSAATRDQLILKLNTSNPYRSILKTALIHSDGVPTEDVIANIFPEVTRGREENNAERQEENAEYLKEENHWEFRQMKQFRQALLQSKSDVGTLYAGLTESNKNRITDAETEKVRTILLSLLGNFEPLQGHINVVQEGDSRRSRMDRRIMDFTDAVLLIPVLGIDPTLFRGKILQSLLFIYEDEQLEKALILIPEITEREISAFSKKYTAARQDDLVAESLSKFVGLCKSIDGLADKARLFLMGLLLEEAIPYYDRLRILGALPSLQTDENKLISLFQHYSKSTADEGTIHLLKEVNTMLIKLNNIEAVDWRIDLVLSKPYELAERNTTGTVIRGKLDNEDLGRPLQFVTSEKLLEAMLSFLAKSFDLLAKNDSFYRYVRREIWEHVEAYLVQIKLTIDERTEVISRIKRLMEKHNDNNNIHWFYAKIDRIEDAYLSDRSEPISYGEAVKLYLQVRSKQYLDIAYPVEVFQLIQETIDIEFRDWVRQGAYRFIGDITRLDGRPVQREGLIQKTIVSQLENYLMKRGFRAADMTLIEPLIFREAQLPDDRRVDLVINYGAIGSVMVEIKRMGNDDLNSGNLEEYKEKFMAYLQQTGCSFGIYLIFLDRKEEGKRFASKLDELRTLYQEDNIAVIGINCLGDDFEEE